MKKWILVSLAGLCFGMTACEDKNDDKVFSAQQCLDKAGQGNANVDDCVNMINGISTPKAFVIRCSADFLRQGIDNDTIVEAIKNLDENTTGNDPTVVLFDKFHFTDDADGFTTQANDYAQAAVNNCSATGSDTLKMLALANQAATTLYVATGGVNLQTFIDTFDPNTTTLTAEQLASLGGSINNMAPIACGKGGAFEGNDVCKNIAEAQGQAGGDLEALAKQFLDQMKD